MIKNPVGSKRAIGQKGFIVPQEMHHINNKNTNKNIQSSYNLMILFVSYNISVTYSPSVAF